MMTVDMIIFNTTTWIFFSETCFFILQLNGSEEFITAIAVCWNRLLSANFYSSVNVNTVKRVGASLVEQWLWNGPPVQGTSVDPFWGTESPCVKGQLSLQVVTVEPKAHTLQLEKSLMPQWRPSAAKIRNTYLKEKGKYIFGSVMKIVLTSWIP